MVSELLLVLNLSVFHWFYKIEASSASKEHSTALKENLILIISRFLEDFPEAHEMVMANLEKLGIEVPAQSDEDDVDDDFCEDC